jgi:FMN phosphatase YigB (HAD superfamily)
VGLVRPDPAIFHQVCDRLCFQPTEILFVGDPPSADIEGPRAIGMPAMLISDFQEYTRREGLKPGELPENLLTAIQRVEYGSGHLDTPPSDRGAIEQGDRIGVGFGIYWPP